MQQPREGVVSGRIEQRRLAARRLGRRRLSGTGNQEIDIGFRLNFYLAHRRQPTRFAEVGEAELQLTA